MDLEDIINQAVIDLQSLVDTGTISEDHEGLYEAFGGKPGAGTVAVPSNITDKQILAYFDFVGTPLTGEEEKATILKAVREKQKSVSLTKEKPTAGIYSTLNKEEKKAVAAFQEIQATLFPDGDIPSVEQVRANIDSGNFTVRDAFIASMYDKGVPEQPLLSELDETKDFYKKFEKAFTKNVIGPAPGTMGIAGNLRSVTRQGIDFNSSFTELEKASLDPASGITEGFRTNVTRPLRTSSDNVLQLKLASRGAAKGTQKIAKGAIPPEVLRAVLDGISDIPDDVTRDAVMASLLGYRGTDLSGIRTSRTLAVRAGTPRPYYDRESGITRDPEVSAGRGRKGAGPDRPPGPVLREILNRRFDAAGPTGELFPDIETSTITAALKKHVFSKIPQDVLDNLIKPPSGYTDLRRITASAIANQLGRPDLASQIISHKGEDIIDAVMTGYYTDVEDLSGLEQRGQILSAYEKMMADAVDATDAKGLGDALNLKLPAEFNADYDDIDISTPSSAPTTTRQATPDEIAQGERVRQAKTDVQVEKARLESATAGQQADETILARAERAEEVAAAEEKIAQAKADKRKQTKVEKGKGFLQSIVDTYGKPMMVGASYIGAEIVGQVLAPFTEYQQARAEGAPQSEAIARGALELAPVAPSDIRMGEELLGAAGQQMKTIMEAPQPSQPQGRSLTQQMGDLLRSGGGQFNF